MSSRKTSCNTSSYQDDVVYLEAARATSHGSFWSNYIQLPNCEDPEWQRHRVQKYEDWRMVRWRGYQAWVFRHLHTSTKWSGGKKEQNTNHSSKSNVEWLWHVREVLGGSNQYGLPCIQPGVSPPTPQENAVWTHHREETKHLLLSSLWLQMLHL